MGQGMSDLSFGIDGGNQARGDRQRGGGYCLDVVVPCYNEEVALPRTIPVIVERLRALVADASNQVRRYRIILVDDGSSDRTWSVIQAFSSHEGPIEGLKLSRNFGHQSAMLAGLTMTDADVVITMDADLQDDIEAIAGMIAAYEAGAHLALGVRSDRSTDTAGKKGWANGYYRLLALLGIRIVENHADFRLMSRTALDALLQYREVNLFLRGLIPTLGFTVALVPYKRQARTAGETKYTLRKMLRLAIDGITSFSVMPLRIIAMTGAAVFAATMIATFYFLVVYLRYSAEVVPGWTSTVLPMLFLGGVQLLSIGVLGEYVGKIYMETKRRPRFIIERATTTGLATTAGLAAHFHAMS